MLIVIYPCVKVIHFSLSNHYAKTIELPTGLTDINKHIIPLRDFSDQNKTKFKQLPSNEFCTEMASEKSINEA